LEDSSSEGSEYDEPTHTEVVGTSSRGLVSLERRVPAKDRDAYEWLKRKLENWNFKGGRTTFLDKLERPVSTSINLQSSS
jgi:hypothetical protein